METLDRLRKISFQPVEEVRATAREEYNKYIDDVMSSDFSKYGLK